MIQNVVQATGGLHNRVRRRIRLLPFTLAETEVVCTMNARPTRPIVDQIGAFG